MKKHISYVFVAAALLCHPGVTTADDAVSTNNIMKPTVTDSHNALRAKVGLPPLPKSTTEANAETPARAEATAKECTPEEFKAWESILARLEEGGTLLSKPAISEALAMSAGMFVDCDQNGIKKLTSILMNPAHPESQTIALAALSGMVMASGTKGIRAPNATEFAENLIDLLMTSPDAKLRRAILLQFNTHGGLLALKTLVAGKMEFPKKIRKSQWLNQDPDDEDFSYLVNPDSVIFKAALAKLKKSDPDPAVRKTAAALEEMLINLVKARNALSQELEDERNGNGPAGAIDAKRKTIPVPQIRQFVPVPPGKQPLYDI